MNRLIEEPADSSTERRAKLVKLRAAGPAYPNDFSRTHFMHKLQELHAGAAAQELEALQVAATIAGRLLRRHAASDETLAVLRDASGEMQISVSDAASGVSNHAAFTDWDVGDIVGVTGILYRSAAGVLTLRAHDIRLLVKSLRPVPDQHELRRITLIRSRLLMGIRDFMRRTNYMEVETPLLQPAPDPAAPAFETYHNALQLKLYLRSAATLYLQSLVIGGVEKVYEINRSFRNESEVQRPVEVTIMEIYCAYTTYHYMMTLLERVIAHAISHALGTTRVSLAGREVDFGAQFARAEFTQALVDGVAPTFVVDFPAHAAPGARGKDHNPGVAEYFRLFAGGVVLAEGLSALNDPGIPVGHDADFVRALEYGMPPSCGARLEIDRLVALLAGRSDVRPC